MNLSTKYCMCLIWLVTMFTMGILLFAKGFLLKRVVVDQNSTCDVDFATGTDQHGPHRGCWTHGRYQKAVIIIIDALRYDFVTLNHSLKAADELPYQNKFKFLNGLLSRKPQNSRLYRFIADPPTTTMQRLKGLTTGSLPTFVDAGSNFASAEITEDNIIDQLLKLDKKISFMGDDTWTGLFPNRFHRFFPYPSLNVKDLHTVDNGVVEHLVPELRRTGWDVIIAHFLGVDHCGHRYGPDHQAMAEKLLQMDNVIRSVVKELDEDTILFVFGDHGMTRTGDHGGDSWPELDSALFVYSPAQITASHQKDKHEVVSQIDFVPTISLLLGTPIPFSNLGKTIPDLFNYCPWWKTSASLVKQVYHTVKALRLNAHQVRLYLQTYSEISDEFPAKQATKLERLFHSTESELQDLVTMLHLDSSATDQSDSNILHRLTGLQDNYQNYLDGAKLMCQGIWAKFDLHSMVLGLSVVSVALMLSVYLLMVTNEDKASNVHIIGSLVGSVWFSLLVGLLYVFDLTVSGLILALSLGIIIILAVGLLVHQLFKSQNQENTAGNGISVAKKCNWSQYTLLCFSIGSIMLYMACYFSNSYVVYEDYVTSFLLQSWVWVQVFQIMHDRGLAKMHEHIIRKYFKHEKAVKFDIGHMFTSPACILVMVGLLCCACVRVSTVFRACREEQWNCLPSHFQQPMSALAQEMTQYKNLRYLLSVSSLIAIIIASRLWMRKYGNLNGDSPSVICALYMLPASAACVCFYWALQALPSSIMDKMPVWQQVILPNGVYLLTVATVVVLLLKPMCLYLVKQESDEMLNLYGLFGTNIVPKVYNHIKMNWKKHFLGDMEESKPPLVYGLATVYSAPTIMLLTAVAILLALLIGDGMAPTIPLQLGSMFLLLEIHACHQRVLPRKTGDVPWPAVYAWGLLASHFFFANGHHMTVTTIRWESAYIGFHDDFQSYIIPAILIVLNTFASHVLCVVAAPLLLLWPQIRGRFPLAYEKGAGDAGLSAEEKKGEFVWNEDNVGLRTCVFKLVLGYTVFMGCKILASMCAAALHRRHLMVWKIFAPRLVFEGATFFVVMPMLLLMYLFVLRVDSALTKWIQRLEA